MKICTMAVTVNPKAGSWSSYKAEKYHYSVDEECASKIYTSLIWDHASFPSKLFKSYVMIMDLPPYLCQSR